MRTTLPLVLLCIGANAQSVRPLVEDLVVHAASTPPRVDFTLSWPNGWHTARNHDAAWLLLRGPDARRAPLRLNPAGHDAHGGTVPAAITPSDDGVGAFIAPAAPHRGAVRWRVSLALAEAPPSEVHAWAVGMVFIPPGGYELGDDDPLAVRFGAFYRRAEDGTPAGPIRVASEAALDIAERSGALWYETDRHGYRGDRGGPLPAAWPKGTAAFYVMKHELAHGAYAAFLDALPEEWASLRAPLQLDGEETETCSIRRTEAGFVAAAPERPCNFVSWDDTCALYDWLALRPWTELEYEKAARGPHRPVAGDYPWGTASTDALRRRVTSTRDLEASGATAESALDETTTAELGASHYWVMDLSGSLWERVVSAGHERGRAFAGSHGDGVLDENARATNSDWPHTEGADAPGMGYRGGAEYFAQPRDNDPTNPYSPVAVRTYAGWGGAQRYKTYSARAARTAPTATGRERPSPEEAAALRTELLQRKKRDQAVRSVDFSALSVDRYGWPSAEWLGDEAAGAAFLLVQHADQQPEFQARCLPMLAAAAARGEASPSAVAYLTDRVRVSQQRPQLYGTQYHAAENDAGVAIAGDDGRVLYLTPVVEDTASLDDRRRAMGLGPWQEYEERMARLHGRAQAAPRAWDGALPVRASQR